MPSGRRSISVDNEDWTPPLPSLLVHNNTPTFESNDTPMNGSGSSFSGDGARQTTTERSGRSISLSMGTLENSLNASPRGYFHHSKRSPVVSVRTPDEEASSIGGSLDAGSTKSSVHTGVHHVPTPNSHSILVTPRGRSGSMTPRRQPIDTSMYRVRFPGCWATSAEGQQVAMALRRKRSWSSFTGATRTEGSRPNSGASTSSSIALSNHTQVLQVFVHQHTPDDVSIGDAESDNDDDDATASSPLAQQNATATTKGSPKYPSWRYPHGSPGAAKMPPQQQQQQPSSDEPNDDHANPLSRKSSDMSDHSNSWRRASSSVATPNQAHYFITQTLPFHQWDETKKEREAEESSSELTTVVCPEGQPNTEETQNAIGSTNNTQQQQRALNPHIGGYTTNDDHTRHAWLTAATPAKWFTMLLIALTGCSVGGFGLALIMLLDGNLLFGAALVAVGVLLILCSALSFSIRMCLYIDEGQQVIVETPLFVWQDPLGGIAPDDENIDGAAPPPPSSGCARCFKPHRQWTFDDIESVGINYYGKKDMPDHPVVGYCPKIKFRQTSADLPEVFDGVYMRHEDDLLFGHPGSITSPADAMMMANSIRFLLGRGGTCKSAHHHSVDYVEL